LIANPALLWTGNHYQVATLQAHGNDGQYTANNVIATNGRGDCGLEAFLLMLHGIHPALQLGPLPTDNDRLRPSRIRSFARTYLAPRVDGLLNTDDVHYVSARASAPKVDQFRSLTKPWRHGSPFMIS